MHIFYKIIVNYNFIKLCYYNNIKFYIFYMVNDREKHWLNKCQTVKRFSDTAPQMDHSFHFSMNCLLSSKKITLFFLNNGDIFQCQDRLNKFGIVKVFNKDLKNSLLQRVLLEIRNQPIPALKYSNQYSNYGTKTLNLLKVCPVSPFSKLVCNMKCNLINKKSGKFNQQTSRMLSSNLSSFILFAWEL